jgi:hypothetical protein
MWFADKTTEYKIYLTSNQKTTVNFDLIVRHIFSLFYFNWNKEKRN